MKASASLWKPRVFDAIHSPRNRATAATLTERTRTYHPRFGETSRDEPLPDSLGYSECTIVNTEFGFDLFEVAAYCLFSETQMVCS